MRRLIEAKIPLEGASDHGVSEALYLRDPDDNGVELYWDRPKEAWPLTADGKLAMFTRRLDLTNLLAENDEATPGASRRAAVRAVAQFILRGVLDDVCLCLL